MDVALRRELIAFLGQFVTENKRRKIAEVLRWRTRYITFMLEDIYQPQNASATLRTADALGIQDVYIAENWNAYKVNPDVALGAHKWVDLHRFRSPWGAADPAALERQHEMPAEFPATAAALEALRARGYRIVATSPHGEAWSLEDVPLDRPLAFLFGNEREGLSPYALEHADASLRLPMYGFVESFNISVSVAITLSHLRAALHRAEAPWPLSEAEREELTLRWYRRIVERHAVLERAFYRRRGLPLPPELADPVP
ncbi:MAG TPA: TrmH family RNA methyltransferase [Chloroflexi bacterium]|nr:TrmH family RNA methyltransferase [Chloroflexota bacterium]